MVSPQRKLLIVDDVDLVRSFLQNLFELYNFDTELAANGQEAVDLWAAKDSFGVILMDLDMPVMGGIEATKFIRMREEKEMRLHTPIYAVSGRVSSTSYDDCLDAGMDGFIAKPVGIKEILETILPLFD